MMEETGGTSLWQRRKLRKHREKKENENGIGMLPEDCIARILSLTSPRDACASSLASPIFKSAADSDDVWDKFLPPLDFKDILPNHSSKKQLYSRLCAGPVLLHGGNKSISLEKSCGKICFMIGSKELTIIWYDTINWVGTDGRAIDWGEISYYWKCISSSHSRFGESIELVENDWHQISGRIETRLLSPETTYGAYLVFKLTDYAFGFGCHGDIKNEIDYGYADISVEFVRGEGGTASGSDFEFLDLSVKPRPPHRKYALNHDFSIENEGGWMELKIGTFYTGEGNGGEVEFIVKEKDNPDWRSLLWKSGLVIQGVELRAIKIK